MNRVFRYAPSPTGRIHLGQIKAAFLPYILAKKYVGEFILRIEDTDNKRNQEDAVRNLAEDLKWLGIEYDKGPSGSDIKNEYFQSQRQELYKKYIDQLLAENKAYKAYETPEERTEQIKQQRSKGQSAVYNGNHANLSQEDITKYESEGRIPVIRLRVPNDKLITFEDKVYGKVTVNTNQIGDLVIQKSDGTPMYNFCVVIDDHEMGVTDVVRGFGHLSNTSKQVLIYQILGWESPQFAHFSDILNENVPGKLSKRHGAKSILQYRAEGYLPEALINYIVLISTSLKHTSKEDEIMSREKILEIIDYDIILKTNAKFNSAKLDWLNGQHIRLLGPDKFEEHFFSWLENDSKHIQTFIPDFDIELIDKFISNKDLIRNFLPLVIERTLRLLDVLDYLKFVIDRPIPESIDITPSKHKKEEVADVIHILYERLTQLEDWQQETWETTIREIGDELSWKHGDVFMVLRLAIVGRPFSPPLFESMINLGKEECLLRLKDFM